MPYRTPEGKWLVWDKQGRQREQWPIDAKAMARAGDVSLEPPDGVEPKLPPAPPRAVGIPAAPAVKVFEGVPGDVAGGESKPTRTRKSTHESPTD